MEDINNILCFGEATNLMLHEDLDEILSNLRLIVKDRSLVDNVDKALELYKQKVKDNLHVVLNFSPVGTKFK